MRVSGITVTHVKGYGEYVNFFTMSWKVRHARIEIFTERGCEQEIARAIVDAADTGTAGDEIVALLPVESVIRIRTGTRAAPEELR